MNTIQEGRGRIERKIEKVNSDTDNKGAGETSNNVCVMSRVFGSQKESKATAKIYVS